MSEYGDLNIQAVIAEGNAKAAAKKAAKSSVGEVHVGSSEGVIPAVQLDEVQSQPDLRKKLNEVIRRAVTVRDKIQGEELVRENIVRYEKVVEKWPNAVVEMLTPREVTDEGDALKAIESLKQGALRLTSTIDYSTIETVNGRPGHGRISSAIPGYMLTNAMNEPKRYTIRQVPVDRGLGAPISETFITIAHK